jgi:hypothetical protein
MISSTSWRFSAADKRAAIRCARSKSAPRGDVVARRRRAGHNRGRVAYELFPYERATSTLEVAP